MSRVSSSSSALVPVAAPRKIVEVDRRNPSLILPPVLQLRSWENVSACLIYGSRPGCATGCVVNMIDDESNAPDSWIGHVEESETSHVGGMYRRNQLLERETS